jgi:hypothetical protein
MNGKGSKVRPLAIKSDEFASNWDAAFGAKKKKKKEDLSAKDVGRTLIGDGRTRRIS